MSSRLFLPLLAVAHASAVQEYLQSQHCVENLLAYSYSKFYSCFDDADARRHYARVFCEDFVVVGAPHEVNVQDVLRKKILSNLQAANVDLFQPMQEELITLMTPRWREFMTSVSQTARWKQLFAVEEMASRARESGSAAAAAAASIHGSPSRVTGGGSVLGSTMRKPRKVAAINTSGGHGSGANGSPVHSPASPSAGGGPGPAPSPSRGTNAISWGTQAVSLGTPVAEE